MRAEQIAAVRVGQVFPLPSHQQVTANESQRLVAESDRIADDFGGVAGALK